MRLEITLCVAYLALMGCSATCLRDSDCIGAALCKEDRCILIVKRDAGSRGATPTPPSTPDSTPDSESDSESDSPVDPDASAGSPQ